MRRKLPALALTVALVSSLVPLIAITSELVVSTQATLYSIDDSYARQDQPDINYGGGTSISISHSASWEKRGFIKFDISSLPPDAVITSAIVNARYDGRTAAQNIDIWSVTNDDWNEEEITWNNKPDHITKLDTYYVEVGTGWLEYSVTNFVQSEFAGDKIASFCFLHPTVTTGYCYLSTKESTYDPYLYIEYAVPPAVTTLAATNVEYTTANPQGNVTDIGEENPTRYIEYDIDSGAPYEYSKDCGVGGTGTYDSNLTDLLPGTQYYYRAKATNSGGTSYGSEMTFTTLPLGNPSSLNAYYPTSTTINLSWKKGSGADKTMVRRKTGSYPTSTTDGTQVYFDTGTSTTDTGLSTETTYFYRAWAYDTGSGCYSAGYSEDSETTTIMNAAPNKPTNLLPSTLQTTTTVEISCIVTDNDGNKMNVFFYEKNPASIAFDNVSTTTGGGPSLTWAHTTSGSNRILFVGVSLYALDEIAVNKVTYGGDDLTFLRQDNKNQGPYLIRAPIWYLVNPSLGPNNIVVTLSDSCDGAVCGAISYTGVDQVDPIDNHSGAYGYGYGDDAASASVNVNTKNSWVMAILSKIGSGTTSTSDTKRYDTVAAYLRANGADKDGPQDTGLKTISFSWSSNAGWSESIVSFRSAPEKIENIWIDNGATAQVTWSGLTRGQTYTFFARGQDNIGAWGVNSDAQSFTVNSLPTTTNPLCEGETNPAKMTDPTPTFSWTYNDSEGDPQSQWYIQVGTSVGGNDMWDTGELSGSDASDVYDGSVLQDSTTYYWRVKTKDEYEWSDWATGQFTTSFNEVPEVLDSFAPDSADPNIAFDVKIEIRDNNNISDVDEVWLKVYASAKAEGDDDSARDHYTFKWIRGTGFSEVGPGAGEHIITENCVAGDDAKTTDNFLFKIKLGVTASPNNSWNVWAKVIDNAGEQDNQEFTNKFDVSEYTSLSIDTPTLTFTGAPGDTDLPSSPVKTTCTVTSNYAVDIEVKLLADWSGTTHGGTILAKNTYADKDGGIPPYSVTLNDDVYQTIWSSVGYGEGVEKNVYWFLDFPLPLRDDVYLTTFHVRVVKS